jgi:hypothetical protein
MEAFKHVLHLVGLSECPSTCSFQDVVLLSNEDILEAMVHFEIPADSFDCVLRLDSFPVESNPNFPFEFDLIVCGSLDIGVFESPCSTIEMQVGVP